MIFGWLDFIEPPWLRRTIAGAILFMLVSAMAADFVHQIKKPRAIFGEVGEQVKATR